MIAAQLHLPSAQAAIVLRAHSAAHGQDVIEIAAGLVDGLWGFDT